MVGASRHQVQDSLLWRSDARAAPTHCCSLISLQRDQSILANHTYRGWSLCVVRGRRLAGSEAGPGYPETPQQHVDGRIRCKMLQHNDAVDSNLTAVFVDTVRSLDVCLIPLGIRAADDRRQSPGRVAFNSTARMSICRVWPAPGWFASLKLPFHMTSHAVPWERAAGNRCQQLTPHTLHLAAQRSS